MTDHDITILHNPACGTSRATLALIRDAGIEPNIVEYVTSPPSRETLVDMLRRGGLRPRDVLREKGTPFAELGLDDESLGDDALIAAMLAHPILIQRPLVSSPRGVKLCRPSETVLELLPATRPG